MLNKNFSDVEELARAIMLTVKELQDDEVNIDKRDIQVKLTVSPNELKVIDRELYERTKANYPDRPYKEAQKVLADVGGIVFEIVTPEEEKSDNGDNETDEQVGTKNEAEAKTEEEKEETKKEERGNKTPKKTDKKGDKKEKENKKK